MRLALPMVRGTRGRGLWLAALALALCGAARGAVPAADAVGLDGVRFGGDAATTRVVLDLEGAVTGKAAPGESAPDRLVFTLPPLLSEGPMRGRGQGLVADWAIRADARGDRLVLDVTPGASVTHRFLIPPAAPGGPWRYVIDLAAAGGESPAPPAQTSATAPSPRTATTAAVQAYPAARRAAPPLAVVAASHVQDRPRTYGLDLASLPLGDAGGEARGPSAPVRRMELYGSPEPAPASDASGGAIARPAPPRPALAAAAPGRVGSGHGLKIVVIDAGHGGHDTGARSLVRNEKDITLAAALDLRERLLKMGRYRVVLTRDSDVFIPLETRVQIARRAGADLFISLHADSAGSDPTPHGASVYTLSDHGETRVNYVLGPHEWFSHVGDRRYEAGVGQILLDLTQTSTRNRSSQFAGILIDHLSDRVDLLPRSHRDAGYFVLLAPDVPAVLLEMGFITNPADEMRLTDPVERGKMMSGVADAIDAYFTDRPRLAAG